MRENGKCPGPETGTGLTEGGHLRRVKDQLEAGLEDIKVKAEWWL